MKPAAAGEARCECGQSRALLKASPLMRAICHCQICQAFNQAPFADITVYRSADVELLTPAAVDFQRLRKPPAVDRGKCRHCGKPAIESLKLPALPALTMLPSANCGDQSQLPEPALHMFYHRRQADSDDGLPKFNGYLGSQLGFSRYLLPALWRRRSRA